MPERESNEISRGLATALGEEVPTSTLAPSDVPCASVANAARQRLYDGR